MGCQWVCESVLVGGVSGGGVSVDVGVCVNGFLCQWVGMYVWVGVLMGVCVGGSVWWLSSTKSQHYVIIV